MDTILTFFPNFLTLRKKMKKKFWDLEKKSHFYNAGYDVHQLQKNTYASVHYGNLFCEHSKVIFKSMYDEETVWV